MKERLVRNLYSCKYQSDKICRHTVPQPSLIVSLVVAYLCILDNSCTYKSCTGAPNTGHCSLSLASSVHSLCKKLSSRGGNSLVGEIT